MIAFRVRREQVYARAMSSVRAGGNMPDAKIPEQGRPELCVRNVKPRFLSKKMQCNQQKMRLKKRREYYQAGIAFLKINK